MFEAIWRFFESGGWPIAHKKSCEGLVSDLKSHGVSRYALLNYVKRPGQAESLNEWTSGFARSHPEALPFGTFHAEDPDPWGTVARYLEEKNFLGVKLQPLVCRFGVDDPRIRPALDNMARLGKVLVVHTGTAPYANEWVGLDRLERMMQRTPDLTVILAHMGAFEIERAIELADANPNLYLDTAMIFVNTDLFDTHPELGPGDVESRAERILFGSDFPNVPYPYREALESIERLPISGEAKSKIMGENARLLFGLDGVK